MATHVLGSQVRIVIRSMKSQIADAILAKVSEVARIETVEFDRVRLRVDDFTEVQMPAVQLIDVNELVEHQQARAKKTWLIALELVMKATVDEPVSQQDLWNLQYEIERKLWAVPNLGIPGVIQLRYLGSQTDLHLLEPYYFVRMDFEVLYYEHLVRDC